jgi:citrate lyase beta subunit
VKGGADTELVVRVNRLNGYQGEFKVQLVLPQGFQGVTAAEATIPANATETKLVLKGAPNAAPAMNANVVVRATATVEKVTLTHEAKVAVTIQK